MSTYRTWSEPARGWGGVVGEGGGGSVRIHNIKSVEMQSKEKTVKMLLEYQEINVPGRWLGGGR